MVNSNIRSGDYEAEGEFTETTLEAMRKAQLTSLTARIGLEEYACLRTRGVEPKVLYSKSHGYRVRDPALHSPSNGYRISPPR